MGSAQSAERGAPVPRFAFPENMPENIRIFDVGGSGLKSKRFRLIGIGHMSGKRFVHHADFAPHLEPEVPLEGQLNLGKYRGAVDGSPMEWISRHVDEEVRRAGVARDSEKSACTVSNGFLSRVGLDMHWRNNFDQSRPFPDGLPIVDPSNNMDGTGGIDDALAHFYDAQLHATSSDYPLLNVACGTYGVFLFAETEDSMPTRGPMIPAGKRLFPYVRELQSLGPDSARASEFNEKIEEIGEEVAQQVFATLEKTLRQIANRDSWASVAVVDRTCQLNYPEIANDQNRQIKDPCFNGPIKTVVFSGGVSQKLNLAQRADDWRHRLGRTLPGGHPELTFRLGHKDAPYTGAAAYALDHIMHPNPEERVFKPKFPNGRY